MTSRKEYSFGHHFPGTDLTFLFETDPRENKPGKKRRMIFCSCECGKFTEVLLEAVTSKRTKTCGCLQRRVAAEIKYKGSEKSCESRQEE